MSSIGKIGSTQQSDSQNYLNRTKILKKKQEEQIAKKEIDEFYANLAKSRHPTS